MIKVYMGLPGAGMTFGVPINQTALLRANKASLLRRARAARREGDDVSAKRLQIAAAAIFTPYVRP